MEKRIYWFLGLLITGMFCVSCSENEDVSVQRRVTEAEKIERSGGNTTRR